MINPQAGAYVGNSLYLKCLMYTCVISTYILNILTYVQINLRVIPNSLSIQTTSQQFNILIYTSLVSHNFEFIFVQGVRHPLSQGLHRPLLLNTSWN